MASIKDKFFMILCSIVCISLPSQLRGFFPPFNAFEIPLTFTPSCSGYVNYLIDQLIAKRETLLDFGLLATFEGTDRDKIHQLEIDAYLMLLSKLKNTITENGISPTCIERLQESIGYPPNATLLADFFYRYHFYLSYTNKKISEYSLLSKIGIKIVRLISLYYASKKCLLNERNISLGVPWALTSAFPNQIIAIISSSLSLLMNHLEPQSAVLFEFEKKLIRKAQQKNEAFAD